MQKEMISLNGSWEMAYQKNLYQGRELPNFEGVLIPDAVPGYWEDMEEIFAETPFGSDLVINPEYSVLRYPTSMMPWDTKLPNYLGNFFYRKTFQANRNDLPAALTFAGVQNRVSAWINGIYIGEHQGFSTPFEMEIPADVLHIGENTIVLSVSNFELEGYGQEPVIGLANRAVNECTGGITGDVGIRYYPSPLRDAYVLVSKDCQSVTVKVEMTEPCTFAYGVYDGETLLCKSEAEGDFVLATDGMEYWSPEHPKLYRLELVSGEEKISRIFGVRRLTADKEMVYLNGMPTYLRGICEHCYYPETMHLHHDKEAYEKIVTKLKELGFNFVRFHTYVPPEEYMQAADELGMLFHVESANNTSEEEWKEIVRFCRNHPSVVVYCSGNEQAIDEELMEHLEYLADVVHTESDSLFSPMSALRGVEYGSDEQLGENVVKEPFPHHPGRFELLSRFCDVYNSYANGRNSYSSLKATPEELDGWYPLYQKPRLSHEICISGTYTDLSLKERYQNSRFGKLPYFSSIEEHLRETGVLDKAPMYFEYSSKWQSMVRKYSFEQIRRCKTILGFDYLGPIDTHWHTVGYDVGMMNEFYELKPGETVENVRRYNGETVLLHDIGRKFNFAGGDDFSCGIHLSHFGEKEIQGATLTISLLVEGAELEKKTVSLEKIEKGVSGLSNFSATLPEVSKPKEMKLLATLEWEDKIVENRWDLYLFPKKELPDAKDLVISEGMSEEELKQLLAEGKDVLLLGAEPFQNAPTLFQIAIAGRVSGQLATVIHDHPLTKELPHDGFCGYQFDGLMTDGKMVIFADRSIPFHPIVENVSPHKYVLRQASLFEYRVMKGRLLVCSMNFRQDDPGADWLKGTLISYATGDQFNPKDYLGAEELESLIHKAVKKADDNNNLAFNINDKAAVRRNKK